MDFDEFEKRMREERRKNFESFQKAFNEEMRRRGSNQTLDDVLGAGPKQELPRLPEMFAFDPEHAEQLVDLFLDIHKETADDDARVIVLRAMAVYRSFCKHARAGGQVKFVGVGADKTLKVRLR